MSELLTFTDEKLGEYLSVWEKLIEQGQKKMLSIELTVDMRPWPFRQPRYTLAYGEEMRDLTEAQFYRVQKWMMAESEVQP